jgi:NAD(P)-dependent dehydrogenase (short-subunit alcohol dehydrogenase family)
VERDLHAAGLRPGELSERLAVVTGAARGIGRAAACALAHLGAQVAVVDVAAEGEETAAQIRRAGGAARFYPADVADGDAVAHLARQVGAEMGRPDLLICNAALCPVAPVEEMHPTLWDRVLAVNLRGPFLLARAFLPALRSARQGVLVNLVSADAMPGLSAYSASKQGLVGFTQSLAAEVGEDGPRVVALAPGMVETPGLLEAAAGLAPLLGMSETEFRRVSLHPSYAGLMPVEHAGVAVAFLVSRLAGEYHGQVVSGYEVLERAGLIGAGAAPLVGGAGSTGAAGTPTGAPALVDQLDRLRALLAETDADFRRLPLFVRPLARSGFRSKAGRSLEAWRQQADQARECAASGRPFDWASLRADVGRLLAYVRGVPEETARFTRDPAVLGEVARRTEANAAALEALMGALENM